ncbi:hypothetical protein NESM_000199700 [Novymonas esmeraldas]|uniref:Uncharacterized protein n=1 Tax=Novymonas esmeraldas TaxID=1808958 RepID=A0AAW0F528_9TRYP
MCRSGLTAASCCSARSPALRVATQRTSSLCGGATAAAAMLVHAKRYVQFEQTGETMVGINKKKRAMNSRWVTKSTKEYMGEADSKVMKGNSLLFSARDGRRDDMARRKQRTRAVAEETDRIFDLEVDRMREDTGRRWKKVFSFLRRQGKAFTLLYIAAYVVPLAALYIGFATGVLPKDAVFEFLFFFLQKFMVREQFFERVEAWDTYTNFGFAFVVNEMLEVVRFPVVMFFFYQARPFLTGVNHRVKASIFRFNAAES